MKRLIFVAFTLLWLLATRAEASFISLAGSGGGGGGLTSPVGVSDGGTGSTSALNNNRIMKSSGGAIVEASAITASKALVSDVNGIPVASTLSTTNLQSVITALTGDVSATGAGGSAAATISASTVTGKALTGFVSGAGTVGATDTILQAINKLDGNVSAVTTTANAALPSASFTSAAVTGKLLTGFSSSAGTVASTDTILQGFNKLVGNIALKANLDTPTFTGTMTLPNGSTVDSTGLNVGIYNSGSAPGKMLFFDTTTWMRTASGNGATLEFSIAAGGQYTFKRNGSTVSAFSSTYSQWGIYDGTTEYNFYYQVGKNNSVNGQPVGLVYGNATQTGNGAGAETDGQSKTFHANTLASNGAVVRVKSWGTFVSTSNATTAKQYVAGTAIATVTANVSTAEPWSIDCDIERTGSSAEKYFCFYTHGVTTGTSSGTLAFNTASNQTVKNTINGTTANDALAEGMKLWVTSPPNG